MSRNISSLARNLLTIGLPALVVGWLVCRFLSMADVIGESDSTSLSSADFVELLTSGNEADGYVAVNLNGYDWTSSEDQEPTLLCKGNDLTEVTRLALKGEEYGKSNENGDMFCTFSYEG